MEPGAGLTIVLLGATGVGKSASGNTILGYKAFESRPSLRSLTTKITEATEIVFGKQVSVVDTPGILGHEHEVKTWCQELLESCRPCLFLVVVSVGRFTDEQEKALRATIALLGNEGLEKSYMLFTNGDSLKMMSLDEFIDADEEGLLPETVTTFSGRYHLFNNENGGQEQVRQLLIKSGHLQTPDQIVHPPAAGFGDSVRLDEMRIVLLGQPGSGKSSAGNTILGSDLFKTGGGFNAVSTKTVSGSATVEGHQVTVVDTPGFTDEVLSPRQLFDEIMKSITEASPGPHAFIIVVKIGRISTADINLFELLPKLFDGDTLKYSMVLFTHGDELEGQSIEQQIQSNSTVSDLVSMCGDRYCVFDNKNKSNRRQVRELLGKIDEIVTANGGHHFTNDMFRMAETFIAEAERIGSENSETPRAAAQRRMRSKLQRFWRAVRSRFMACCCRRQTLSDEETYELLPSTKRDPE